MLCRFHFRLSNLKHETGSKTISTYLVFLSATEVTKKKKHLVKKVKQISHLFLTPFLNSCSANQFQRSLNN